MQYNGHLAMRKQRDSGLGEGGYLYDYKTYMKMPQIYAI